jgi:succinate dehydrogenase hydrophobic anchor subunit
MPARIGPSHHAASLDPQSDADRAAIDVPRASGSQSARLPGRRRRLPRGVSGVVAVSALTIVLACAVMVTAAEPAAAAQSVGMPPMAVNSLPTIVANLRTWLMGILAGVATLFLTIGGVRYVMAGGDPSEVERAKAAFRSAGIGYALAVIAPVVLSILQSIIGTP